MKKLWLVSLVFWVACKQEDTLFQQLPASSTGIHFNNKVVESDSINPIDMEFLYNGGGVAIGDFNNDSLPDIYFTASQVSNKLYLNRGKFNFEDVTLAARVTGEGRWCNAASVVDINNDGWQDIYVCASIKKNAALRANLFYINQGNQANGLPLFEEMAVQMHLADTGFSVHAPFFDYDNDGDLDMYLVNTKLAERNSTRFDGGVNENKSLLQDKLFRNDGALQKDGVPVFTDVSQVAGIRDEGFGLGVNIADLNDDGWKDIYVTNDFFSNDLLYINQQDGRFLNRAAGAFKHTSRNAMGNDIADINNDALPDIIAVDMNPADNLRKKKNLAANNYYQYQNMTVGTIMLQYVRNTLQLNAGIVKDTSGQSLPVFGDISYYAGVAETDWSWSALLADFDNNGFRDLAITNGYPKDVTDHDFAFFNANYAKQVSKETLLAEIPQVKIPNYIFRNTGTSLRFEDVTKHWGMSETSFSTGAAYADLDRDGDLDYIINNINDAAFVYENRLEKFQPGNFTHIRFQGPANNRDGIGGIAEVFYSNGKRQLGEQSPYRGYLSTMELGLHFGLGQATKIDSILIKWPGGLQQTIFSPPINETIIADVTKASFKHDGEYPLHRFFTEITDSSRVVLRHLESDFIDFDIQRLLPHKLSEYGPGLAVGDVDGNGLDDLFMGSGRGYEASFLLQQSDRRFIKKELPALQGVDVRKPELTGVLLFDVDADSDPDLYTASGSNETVEGSKDYQDRLYINDGRGNFRYDSAALPKNLSSKSCVKAADYDNDGDLDLFIGSRLIPGRYPRPASSFILRNDSQHGHARFTDVTAEVAPALVDVGLICDALWTDIDNDGWYDLLLAGEWMPPTIFKNTNGVLRKVTTSLDDMRGWWTSLLGGDFDNDGDIDYVLGNFGENSFYRGDSTYPLKLYSWNNGTKDRELLLPSLYLPGNDGLRKEFPAHSRDEVMSQMPVLKKKYLSYQSFGKATIPDLIDAEEMKRAFQLKANFFKSVLLENRGGLSFGIHLLPELAQLAPMNGMITEDLNDDGFLDIVACANDYSPEISTGRVDAMHGIVLLGDGKCRFSATTIQQSGFFVPGNARALVKLKGSANDFLTAASQNRSLLKIFRLQSDVPLLSLESEDRNLYFSLKDGRVRKEEIYFGQSFLSQSGRFFRRSPSFKKVEAVNSKGERRLLE